MRANPHLRKGGAGPATLRLQLKLTGVRSAAVKLNTALSWLVSAAAPGEAGAGREDVRLVTGGLASTVRLRESATSCPTGRT